MRTLLAVVLIAHPGAFHVTTQTLSGTTDPLQRVALYSGAPPNDAVEPRAHQVIAIVLEQLSPVDLALFPRRPRHFRLARLGTVEGFNGPRWDELVFRDHGRGFYIFVGVGSRAGEQVPALLRALDSLRVG
jgi:hypothetical protein